MRRRDLFTGGFALAAITLLARPAEASRRDRVLLAAALAMVGPEGERTFEEGRWDPVGDADLLLGRLAPDQRRLLNVAFRLLAGWPTGGSSFSKLSVEQRRHWLALWRVSDNALQRSVWGVLHSIACSSFSSGPAWELMEYPGPNVGTSRPLGQTVLFEWDEVVP